MIFIIFSLKQRFFMSSIKNSVLTGCSLALLLGLSGCARYAARPLAFLPSQQDYTRQNEVSFSRYLFTTRDCHMYLDRNVLVKGFQPIHITITNTSNHSLHFSMQNISVPTIAPYQVAQTVHTNTVGRAVGYGVVGLFFWPFLIPAVVDGIGSKKANEKLDADFYEKALQTQTIEPHGTISGLIFVPVNKCNPHFSITLKDLVTNESISLSDTNPVITIE